MVDPVTARVRTLVDGALDRVFDEPFDVRTAQELEDLVAAGPVGVGAAPAATTVTAFVAAATPMARRGARPGVEVGEGRVEGPVAVVEGAEGGTGVDPGRAAAEHHQPARACASCSCWPRT